MPTVLFVPEARRPVIYPPALVQEIETLAGSPPVWAVPGTGAVGVPPETVVLFSTWEMPLMDHAFLDALPELKGPSYAAGYDLEVVAYDPFASVEEAAGLGGVLVSMEELFRTSEVVSLHTPLLPATRGMPGREHFALMNPRATLINPARGGLIRDDELCAVLAERPGLAAVLDVTDPEPPVPGSPLWDLPNVFLTPHIAGSVNDESRRMDYLRVEEFRRWCEGAPLRHQVSARDLERMA